MFGKGTVKRSRVRHKKKKALDLHKNTLQTLGSGNLLDAVVLPKGEDQNEWLAMNTVDFFNELTVFFEICEEEGKRGDAPPKATGEGFPPGYEYRWKDGVGIKTPIKCSGPEYVDYVLTWVEGQMNNEKIFPTTESTPFPAQFVKFIRVIFKRMFRIFAIIYHDHFPAIETADAVAHINTCFRHFMFLVYEFKLVEPTELKALPGLTLRMYKEYKALKIKAAEEAKKAKKAAKKKKGK